MSINDFNALVSDLQLLVRELKANVDFSFESNNYEKNPTVQIKDADIICCLVEDVMGGITSLDEFIGDYIEEESYTVGDNGKKEGKK